MFESASADKELEPGSADEAFEPASADAHRGLYVPYNAWGLLASSRFFASGPGSSPQVQVPWLWSYTPAWSHAAPCPLPQSFALILCLALALGLALILGLTLVLGFALVLRLALALCLI